MNSKQERLYDLRKLSDAASAGPWITGVFIHGNCQVNADTDYHGKDGSGYGRHHPTEIGKCTQCGRGELVAKRACGMKSCDNQHHVHQEAAPGETSIYTQNTEHRVVDGYDGEYSTENVDREDADFIVAAVNYVRQLLSEETQ